MAGEQRAQELIQFIDSQRDDIFSRTAVVADGDKPGVYICGLGNWGTTNHLMTAPNYKPFEVANIRNAVQDVSVQGIQPIEAETFAAIGADMDVMIIDAAAVKNIAPCTPRTPLCWTPARRGRTARSIWRWPITPTTPTSVRPGQHMVHRQVRLS